MIIKNYDGTVLFQDDRMVSCEGANLRGANLSRAKLPHFQICPEKGFYAYKKFADGIIGTIYIPTKALRTNSLIGRKCRASKARLVEATQGNTKLQKGHPVHSPNRNTKYTVGSIMVPDSYDDDIRVECTHGIHFL